MSASKHLRQARRDRGLHLLCAAAILTSGTTAVAQSPPDTQSPPTRSQQAVPDQPPVAAEQPSAQPAAPSTAQPTPGAPGPETVRPGGTLTPVEVRPTRQPKRTTVQTGPRAL